MLRVDQPSVGKPVLRVVLDRGYIGFSSLLLMNELQVLKLERCAQIGEHVICIMSRKTSEGCGAAVCA